MKFRLKSSHYFDELGFELLEGTIIEAAVPKRDSKGQILRDPKTRKPIIEKMGKVELVAPIKNPAVPFNRQMPQALDLRVVETSWIGPPSIEMEGLDPEAEALCEKRASTYMSINDLPIAPEKPNAA